MHVCLHLIKHTYSNDTAFTNIEKIIFHVKKNQYRWVYLYGKKKKKNCKSNTYDWRLEDTKLSISKYTIRESGKFYVLL